MQRPLIQLGTHESSLVVNACHTKREPQQAHAQKPRATPVCTRCRYVVSPLPFADAMPCCTLPGACTVVRLYIYIVHNKVCTFGLCACG